MVTRLIILTDKQNKGKNSFLYWFKNKIKPTFTIAGIAGSGKTTMLNVAIEELNINPSNVRFCAYTGTAANVLIRKGNPATTIHKLIYVPTEVTDPKTKKKKMVFTLKEKLEEGILLIVIDEVSMVSQKMLEELISFGIPILALGDPFQLPPVASGMNDLLSKPDVFLDEPLRQALDNPIIYIANLLRQNIVPDYGSYGGKVNIYRKNAFPPHIMGDANQILAGRNASVDSLNKFYRKHILGIDSSLPTNGERIICLRNNWDLRIQEKGIENFLVNGLIGTVDKVQHKIRTQTFECNLKPTYFEEQEFKKIIGDSLLFSDPNCKDDYYIQENYPYEAQMRLPLTSSLTKINKFAYANAITVYKSQGAEYPRVLYYDEMLRKDLYFQHFYTGATRAENELDIIR